MKKFAIGSVLLAGTALLAVGCGTTITQKSVAIPKSAQAGYSAAPTAPSTTPAPTAAPAPHPTTVPKAATVGSALAVSDGSGSNADVTLKAVIDPAQGSDEYTTPDGGACQDL